MFSRRFHSSQSQRHREQARRYEQFRNEPRCQRLCVAAEELPMREDEQRKRGGERRKTLKDNIEKNPQGGPRRKEGEGPKKPPEEMKDQGEGESSNSGDIHKQRINPRVKRS